MNILHSYIKDMGQLTPFFSHSALHIYLPIRQFFYDIIHPEYSPVCDVYALMFLIDVVNFIVTIYGYWAFGVRASYVCHQNDSMQR